jgi:hypothetical protein
MTEPISPVLKIVEESSGEVHYILPSRPPQLGRYLIGFGILAPIALIAFAFLGVPFRDDAQLAFVSTPLVLFGLFIAGLGLWFAAGHVEVEIRHGTLRSVSCLGPLRWSRSFPLRSVSGFLINDLAGKAGRAATAKTYKLPVDMATLQACVEGGKPMVLALMYPRDLLQRLADELSRRRELLDAEQPCLENREALTERKTVQEATRQPDKAAEPAPPEQSADGLPTVPTVDLSAKPGTTLRHRLASVGEHPGCALTCVVIFALVWCGFVSFWGYGLVQAHLQNWRNAPALAQGWLWFQTIFFLPFILGGVMLVAHVLRNVYVTLGHRRTRVEVSAQPLHPGEEFEVFVSQSGPLRVKDLRVLFVCQEEASYGAGTDRRTETRRVEELEVARAEAFAIARGVPYEIKRTVRVPVRAMHSFEVEHNKVRWLVVVAGEVVGWPKFEHSFLVVVHPEPGAIVSTTRAPALVGEGGVHE